jgi:hypothetical protein
MAQTLIEGVTNYWCRTQGIHNRDLDTHPQIDDVVILIKFIEEYQRDFTAKQRIYSYVIWDWCYKQRKPLSNKYLKALTKTIRQIESRRTSKQKQLRHTRQKIKALRTLP